MYYATVLEKSSMSRRTITPATTTRILEIETPPGWTVIQSDKREEGLATMQGRIIRIPKLTTYRALWVFFHEVGHVVRRHFSPVSARVPPHVEEFEAEQHAAYMMRLYGFQVSRYEMRLAKDHVANIIRRDEKNGWSIRPDVRQWANNGELA